MINKIIKFTILLLIVQLFSCSDDNDTEDSGQGNYYISAKIDGVNFYRDDAFVSPFADTSSDIFNITTVDNSYIALGLENPTAVGTFTTNTTNDEAHFSFVEENNSWFSYFDLGTAGTITITENNATYMAGTFSFTGQNDMGEMKEITEGEFKAEKL